MIGAQAIEEFQALYQSKYGIKLSQDEATELGTQLIKLVRAVYGQNIPKKWVPKIDRKKSKE